MSPLSSNHPPLKTTYRRYGSRMLAWNVGALVFMYFVMLTPPFEDWMSDVEEAFTFGLNGFMLTDAGWDWTALSFASTFWRFLTLGVAVVGIIWEGKRILQRDYGRVFAFALFAAGLSFITEEVSDTVSDTIRRPPPRKVLPGLLDAPKFYKSDLAMPDETGLPDENVAGLACLWFLLLIRLPLTSRALIAMTFIHGIGQISIGHRWFLDMLSAVFFGGSFAGFSLWYGARGIVWGEQVGERVFLADFWHLLPTVARRAIGKKNASSPAALAQWPTLLDQRDRSARRRIREKVWKIIVEREILPLFNLSPMDSYSLNRQPTGEPHPRWKSSPFVRFLELKNGEVHVVKLAWKFGGNWHRSGRIRQYAAGAKCNLALARLGLPVPQIVWTCENTLWRGVIRYFALVEEFIPGRPLDSSRAEEVEKAIRLLAQMHSHERSYWGPLTAIQEDARESFIWKCLRPDVLFCLGRASERIGDSWGSSIHGRIWERFETEACDLMFSRSPRLRLTHGDVGVRNFMLSDSGVRMIDFLTVGYSLAGLDILRAVHTLTDDAPDMKRFAWINYFKSAGKGRWDEFLSHANLTLCWFALRELAQGRIDHRQIHGAESAVAVYDWICSLFDLDPSVWGNAPEDTDWTTISGLLCRRKSKRRFDANRSADVFQIQPSA